MDQSQSESRETLNSIQEELNHRSDALRSQEVPHFFCTFDHHSGEVAFWANLGSNEACHIIELLAKTHGGEVIDRVVDKLIEDGEPAPDLGLK